MSFDKMVVSVRRITVHVPYSGMSYRVRCALNRLTQIAGGVTITTADGKWYDEQRSIHEEVIRLHSWALFPGYDIAEWNRTLRQLYAELFDSGELAIMVESIHLGEHRTTILTRTK